MLRDLRMTTYSLVTQQAAHRTAIFVLAVLPNRDTHNDLPETWLESGGSSRTAQIGGDEILSEASNTCIFSIITAISTLRTPKCASIDNDQAGSRVTPESWVHCIIFALSPLWYLHFWKICLPLIEGTLLLRRYSTTLFPALPLPWQRAKRKLLTWRQGACPVVTTESCFVSVNICRLVTRSNKAKSGFQYHKNTKNAMHQVSAVFFFGYAQRGVIPTSDNKPIF